jgi:hypothetical protein
MPRLMDSDADPDPAFFASDLLDANKKLIISKKFFCLLLFEGTSFFKDKKVKKKSQSVGIKVFLTIVAWL